MTGPLAMLVIAKKLNPVEQGFYYTFNSVLALQVFVELGLATVLVQVASHEWAFLARNADGTVSGNPASISRLSSLLKFALKWYACSAVIVLFGLSACGYLFFSAKPSPGINWSTPWFALCGIAAVALMMSPFFSLIEGSNEVASIYSFRFAQGIINVSSLICAIMIGAGLYALAIAAFARVFCGVAFLFLKHRQFIRCLLNYPAISSIDWRSDVWPFQWRIGISWVSGYFIHSMFTPIMFYYHGPIVAGQMGMTWAIVSAVEVIAYAWINTRMPHFGMLIARCEFIALDRLFRRLCKITLASAALGSVIIFGLVYLLRLERVSLADRLLPLLPLALLLAQRVINVWVSAMAFYLRAHKREPMMIPSVIAALLTAVSTWILGSRSGPLGATCGFFAVTVIWLLPSCYWTFQHYRILWHGGNRTSAVTSV